jgi:hypothetical protein
MNDEDSKKESEAAASKVLDILYASISLKENPAKRVVTQSILQRIESNLESEQRQRMRRLTLLAVDEDMWSTPGLRRR